jgi:LacI family transcriptional regulator
MAKGGGIVEIARRAKVSPAAVSRALKGGEGLSEDTHRRILKIARQCKYQPKAPRNSLKKVALLMPHRQRCADSYFFRETYSGLADGLFAAGGVLVHVQMVGDATDGTLIRRLRAERMDIAVLLYQTMEGRLSEHLWEAGVHTIAIPGSRRNPKGAVIEYDNIGGVRRLMEHFSAIGRRRLGFIYANPELRYHGERIDVYRETVKMWGITGDEKNEVRARSTATMDGKYAALELMEQYPACDAIFAINDRLALGACRAALELGRKIPGDVAVAGFDDMDITHYILPHLTTVHAPYYAMAQKAALLIRRYLETGEFSEERIVEPTQLIIRESTQICRGDSH